MNLQKHAKLFFLLLVLFELLSLSAYLWPPAQGPLFIVLVLAVLALSLKKLEYGLYVLLAELFIGSKGYLLRLDPDGLDLSIRVALWLAVVAAGIAWCFYRAWRRQIPYAKIGRQPLIRLLAVLAAFVLWGFVNGMTKGNGLGNVFFDLNGWVYFGIIIPLAYVYYIETEDRRRIFDNIFRIMLWSALFVAAKTLVLLYVFSHNFWTSAPEIYRWVRNTGIGEITSMDSGFARIFIQGQIFILPALFYYLLSARARRLLDFLKSPDLYFLTLLLAAVLVSLSRSNWLGMAMALLVFAVYALFVYGWRELGALVFKSAIAGLAALLMVAAIVSFPLPERISDVGAVEALEERTRRIDSEAGASSRWAQLGPLSEAIREHPWLGSGFGRTVTYQSADPRVLNSHPDGLYTTYSFEWGYLDIWLKLGLFGLAAYLALIAYLVFGNFRLKLSGTEPVLTALGFGLIGIAAVSIFSPYLNHPLGIGYISFMAAYGLQFSGK